MSLSAFRQAFFRDEARVHLNNAGLCPISRPARDRIAHWTERFYREGCHCNDEYLAALESSRATFARLIGCEPGGIAYFQNTSSAVCLAAFGLPLGAGDEILTWDQEYGSNLYPWREAAARTGARLVVIPSGPDMATPVERLVERFTDHTRVVAISWVQYQSGAVTDLARLAAACRARGIWTVVDGFQGLGLYPCELDRWGIDVLCTGSHKWLAGPVGVGILAVRRDRLPALRPLVIGAHTYGTCDDPTSAACTLRRDADRFESGSRQVLDILALEASAQLFLETGIGNVLGEVRRLAGILREGLLALGFPVVSPGDPPYGGIVTFSPTGRGRTVAWAAQRLREARITFAPRGPGIRLSPHAHNTDDDIARALACLR